MKTAFASLFRALPKPVKVLAVLSGLLTLLAVAPASSYRLDSGAAGDLPFTLSLEHNGRNAIDEPPCEVPSLVSFSMPVHLPASLSQRPAPKAVAPRIEPSVDDETLRVLQAIAEVESRGNPRRVGRLGERGLYQFRRDTWRQHTRENFYRAHHPGVSTAVARRHYQWILAQLRSRGRKGTAYEVALAWNAGVTSVLRGRAPAQAHSYAQRVVNLATQS